MNNRMDKKAKSSGQRQAEFRNRMRERGYVLKRVWVHRRDLDKFREVEDRFKNGPTSSHDVKLPGT